MDLRNVEISIQQQSQHIPMLGHTEVICHVFVDKDADLQKALKIVRNTKANAYVVR